MMDFPVVAIPLNTLFHLIRLLLQTLMGVESMNAIPVGSPGIVFSEKSHGQGRLLHQLYKAVKETGSGNRSDICFPT